MTTQRIFCLLIAAVLGTGCSSRPNTAPDARLVEHLPLIVAHRAGTADYPENTLLAIEAALRNHADMIWLTVQLSRDGVPVLYRPADLSANTQGSGPVAQKTFAELQQLNAGWNFKQPAENSAYPYRSRQMPIPSLQQALKAIPPSTRVILDMKALPAPPQAHAVAKILDATRRWDDVLIYSTDDTYQQAFASHPHARLFESRDNTRDRLASVALAQSCPAPPSPGTWAAFEYQRKVAVVETFTLGEARSQVSAKFWTPDAMRCFASRGKVNVLVIGAETAEDYKAVACLGVDAVLVDSPEKMKTLKQHMEQPLRCP
ncbi:glycerophosphodiester phosphodiesterase family protein [Pseudomonas sp. Irchel s3a18]|uniref:glycerophosphodiester phosphodiesterase family protein n=1 Tax=Pseudomonas sp. Irchel s3a18 TaxID=2009053 RepID=UPI00211490FD|nr:glycerophosphodiester phosphodiesterase family protein [Pseudomonas sp. Irchel s3a18]